MPKIPDAIKNEPVVVALLLFVTATVALLAAFGVHVTAGQEKAIGGESVALLGLGAVIRSLVSPKGKD